MAEEVRDVPERQSKNPEISTTPEGGGHLDRAEEDGQSWIWGPERTDMGEKSFPSSRGQKKR